ncbi:PAS domain S-box protein [Nostocaceae cyanobacterium CENA369]|uniref:PAS domain S-box protein n=1 Tax=Dendronalium phyllosphericum CENA369 TaxID=1725256 RepID=A0A8J7HYA8_9NOST|nr:PAS domain S-box protein [Dendronalium phyllosphericum]MBH8572475.1 PAS domain S-box protein [Dendronalium phyllosphericum CENA369]
MDKVITSMADALLVTSNTGKIKKINLAAQRLFGFSEEELINRPISLIFDNQDLTSQIIHQHTILQQQVHDIELVCRTKKNEKILVAFSCSLVRKNTGLLEEIIYIGRDITARQHREQRNNAKCAITRILSEAQNIKQAIPQILQVICESLEWDLGELWTPNQYLSPRVQQNNVDVVLRCVEIWSSRVVSVREFKAITWQTTYTPGIGLPGRIWSRRSPLWIRDILDDVDQRRSQPAAKAGLHAAFGFPILDGNEILGVMTFFSREVQSKDVNLLQMMVSIGSQITHFIKRKQAEEALIQSEQTYRDLLDNANVLIQSVNAYGQFLYVNRAWQTTLGYSETEVAGMKLFEIVHPDFQEHCRQMFYRLMSGEKLEQVKTAFITKDNQTIYLEGNINCKFVGGKPVATRGIFHNITQQVLVEKLQYQQSVQLPNKLLLISDNLQNSANITHENLTYVTVLFADIVGFHESAAISAIQLVNLLNSIISIFNKLSYRYGLERIESINDGYMVIAQGSDCAQAIAQMALDMQTAIAKFNAENNQNFHLSIGIHSDAVAVKVMNPNNSIDVYWEEIANTARCVESSGIFGEIQVTEAAAKHLHKAFLLEKSEEIEIKSNEKISTYILLDRKQY